MAPRLQASGLGRRITLRFVLRALREARGGEVLVACRTSNPHVAATPWNGFGDPELCYPSFDPARRSSPELSRVAEAVSAQLWPDKTFVPSNGILIGAYGGSFIPIAPTKHADAARFFEAHVRPERGDAVVQVLRLSPAKWWPMVRFFANRRIHLWKSRYFRPASPPARHAS